MRTKKPQKKAPQDWHSAEIIAALKMRGTNMSALSRANGYSRYALRNALYRPYPKAEKIIASAIGIAPERIWPSRYITNA